jgi:hypothetical protein
MPLLPKRSIVLHESRFWCNRLFLYVQTNLGKEAFYHRPNDKNAGELVSATVASQLDTGWVAGIDPNATTGTNSPNARQAPNGAASFQMVHLLIGRGGGSTDRHRLCGLLIIQGEDRVFQRAAPTQLPRGG